MKETCLHLPPGKSAELPLDSLKDLIDVSDGRQLKVAAAMTFLRNCLLSSKLRACELLFAFRGGISVNPIERTDKLRYELIELESY